VGTLGQFKTLERSWTNNTPSVSCIPEGTYVVKRDYTGKHQYYAITNVPGRTSIEMHGGVVPTHSDGCLLVGMSHDSEFNLQGSPEALPKLIEWLGEDDFNLVIRSYDPSIDNELVH
jgi:hypothetical protein